MLEDSTPLMIRFTSISWWMSFYSIPPTSNS